MRCLGEGSEVYILSGPQTRTLSQRVERLLGQGLGVPLLLPFRLGVRLETPGPPGSTALGRKPMCSCGRNVNVSSKSVVHILIKRLLGVKL